MTLLLLLQFLFLSSCEDHRGFSDEWGKVLVEAPQFFKAADVSDSAVILTRKWYDVAAKAWGNFGPTEFWLVGKSAEAAEELNRK
ncbi:MAG: hypothetical protein ACPG1Z_11090, partial [Planctomycetota bacterium]